MKLTKTLTCRNRAEWRAWLAKHHAGEGEIWLVFTTGKAGRGGLSYEESVEEALCFGWIDSIIQRIDDRRHARKFNPRRPGSNWSALNKRRMARLIETGRMTPAGLAKYDPSAPESSSDEAQKVRRGEQPIPPEIEAALRRNRRAWAFFQSLAPSLRRNYASWVVSAKKDETRSRRLQELIRVLAEGRKLGLK